MNTPELKAYELPEYTFAHLEQIRISACMTEQFFGLVLQQDTGNIFPGTIKGCKYNNGEVFASLSTMQRQRETLYPGLNPAMLKITTVYNDAENMYHLVIRITPDQRTVFN